VSSVEPMPGGATAPFISPTAQRLYDRLPRIYRILDAQQGWALKRYVGGLTAFLGDVDELVDQIRGNRPIGPDEPVPWDISGDERQRWIQARQDVNSALGDPDLAKPEWLPYIAQMLGVYLDPQSGLAERRDTLRFATSGYRGGTRAALADAARPALTGSRFVDVQSGRKADGTVGSMWDVLIRTRSTETPDPSKVIPTIIRQGAKPAGVQLWHASYGTSWDVIEARFPTWTDWDRPWQEIEEAGATYAVPENMAPGPSFEDATDIGKWAPVAEGGGSVSTWALAASAGIDGANAGRLTKVGATGGMRLRSQVINDARILPARDYLFAVSVRPSATTPISLVINWQTAAGAAISSTTVAVGSATGGQWNRAAMTSRHTAPANAARATLDVVGTGTVAAGRALDLDAALFRLITTTGG